MKKEKRIERDIRIVSFCSKNNILPNSQLDKKLIVLARTEIGYSPKTIDIDIASGIMGIWRKYLINKTK